MLSEKMLEAYMLDFSGFSSPAWAPLLSGPGERAAEARAFLQMYDEFDREDFLKIFAESADYDKQCAALAKSFCDIFTVQLALKLGIPHGVRFDRYDHAYNRIVALVPLGTVRWLFDRCAQKRHRPLDGLKRSEFGALWDFRLETDGIQSEAVTRALDALDPFAVGKLLRAFGDPGGREGGDQEDRGRCGGAGVRGLDRSRQVPGSEGTSSARKKTRSRSVARDTHRSANVEDTPTTAPVPPAGHAWRSVYIGAPRRMDGRRFAMIVKRDGGEQIIAPHATIAQALIIALEYRKEHGAAMFYRDRGDFREYIIGRCRLSTDVFEPVLRGVVPRTARIATDHIRALEFFEEVLERDPRVFFDGRLVRNRTAPPADIDGDAT